MATHPGPRGSGPGGPPGTDSNRLLLTVAISMGLVTVLQWTNPPPKPVVRAADGGAPGVVENPVGADGGTAAVNAPGTLGQAPAPNGPSEDPVEPETLVPLGTADLSTAISSMGGRVVRAELLHFNEHPERLGPGVTRKMPVNLGGEAGLSGGGLRLSFEGWQPDASFRVTEQGPARVVFERQGNGFAVQRVYETHGRTTYALRHQVKITNTGTTPRTINPVMEMTAHVADTEKDSGSMLSAGMPTDQTTLACETSKTTTREIAHALTDPVVTAGGVKWAGVDRQYFFGGLRPLDGKVAVETCAGARDKDTARMALRYAPVTLGAGESAVLEMDAYFGPKKAESLGAVDASLTQVIDYGWFGALVRLLLALLLWFHERVNNYGVCIFLLTLAVKLATLPLTQKAFISGQRTKDLAPKIKEMQAKYAHDRNLQGQKMMELYKQEGVSPLSGCIPMLVQMPVWIALYRTLYTSVELYQQPFIPGWIEDLTQKDPFYIAPVVMGIVWLIQAALTPTPEDQPQMKYMQYGFPLVFTFGMLNFPSGLTLYMLMNAVLTILQQLYIKRRFGVKTPPAAAGGSGR